MNTEETTQMYSIRLMVKPPKERMQEALIWIESHFPETANKSKVPRQGTFKGEWILWFYETKLNGSEKPGAENYLDDLAKGLRDFLQADVEVQGQYYSTTTTPTTSFNIKAAGRDAKRATKPDYASIRLTDIVYRTRDVWLPHTCPCCTANLHDNNSLRVTELDIVSHDVHLHCGQVAWTAMREGASGESVYTTGVQCAICDYVFGTAIEREVDSKVYNKLIDNNE